MMLCPIYRILCINKWRWSQYNLSSKMSKWWNLIYNTILFAQKGMLYAYMCKQVSERNVQLLSLGDENGAWEWERNMLFLLWLLLHQLGLCCQWQKTETLTAWRNEWIHCLNLTEKSVGGFRLINLFPVATYKVALCLNFWTQASYSATWYWFWGFWLPPRGEYAVLLLGSIKEGLK